MKQARTLRLPPSLPAALAAPLRRAGHILFACDLIARTALCLLFTTVAVFLFCGLDRLVDIPGVWRLPLPYLTLIGSTLLSLRILQRLCQRTDFDHLAHLLDRRGADRRDRLRSALDFATAERLGEPFPAMAVRRAETFWQPGDHTPDRLLHAERGAARRRAVPALTAALLLAACTQLPAVRAGLLWERFLDPTGNHPRPTATWFELQAPTELKGGDDFILDARLAGRPVQDPAPVLYLHRPDAPTLTRPLTRRPNGLWRMELRDVHKAFSFHLAMGPVRSALHRVTVVPRPTITRITVTYEYPRYSGLKNKTETLSSRTVTALEGTKARLTLHSSIPLASCTGQTQESTHRFRVPRDAPSTATRFLFLSRNERMDFQLIGTNALPSRNELPLHLRVIPDSPPTVNATSTWEERAHRLGDVVSLGFRAQDDLGLAEVAVRADGLDFYQEADLDTYGKRQTEGVLRLPVAQLGAPGRRSVKLRLTALDTKGQRIVTPPLTLRLAVDSYDRQLRTAINALTGTYNSRTLDESGFPSLQRHTEKRVKALRTARGKLTILAGTLPASGPLAAPHESLVEAARLPLGQTMPAFRYLLPSVGPRPDAITTSFDVLALAPLTPRLGRVVAESVLGSELALDGAQTIATFDRALQAADRKEALQTLAEGLPALLKAQEGTARRLRLLYQNLHTELAGILTARLQFYCDLRQAGEASHEGLIHAHGDLRTIAAALAGPLRSRLPADTVEPLLQAAEREAPADALTAATPHLAGLAEHLRTLAAEQQPAEQQSLAAAAAARAAHHPASPDWLDVSALLLLMRIDDQEIHELDLLDAALQQLARYTEREAPALAADRRSRIHLYATLGRLHCATQAFGVDFLANAIQPGQNEFEALWIRMREQRFALQHLLERAELSPALATGVADWSEATQPLAAWTPPGRIPPAERAAAALRWSEQTAALALQMRPQIEGDLAALVQQIKPAWKGLLAAALRRYAHEIDTRIAEIRAVEDPNRPYAMQNAIFRPFPRMVARLRRCRIAVAELLNLASAAAIHEQPQPKLRHELLAAHVLLGKAEKELYSNVGRPISNVGWGGSRKDSTMAAGAKVGKSKAYGELKALLQDILAVLEASAQQTRDAVLEKHVLQHLYNAEAQAIEAATAEASTQPRPGLLGELAASREAAPAVWGFTLVRVQRCAARPADPACRDAARDAVTGLGDLPSELHDLSALLDRLPESAPELDDLLPELRTRAAPAPPKAGETVKHERLLALNRARVRRALAPSPQTDTALRWALTSWEWSRRKLQTGERHVGISGLALGGQDEFAGLKMPRHLYLELKRARQEAMPRLYRDRCYHYLETLMKKAR